MDRHAVDPRFHRKILGDELADYDEACPPVLTYVENHNADPGYDLLAFDYKMAADLLLDEYEKSELGNWSAPTTFIVRQTLELGLKGLLDSTGRLGTAFRRS